MPPKVKFQKEEIVQAALEVAREKGLAGITAREVARALGVSTRPIFTWYETMDQLRRDVYARAEGLYQGYIETGLREPIPFLGVWRQYLLFARQEPALYKLLFLTPPDGTVGGAMAALRFSQALVRPSIMAIYRMDEATADSFFRDIWLAACGFATLQATGNCPYTLEEMLSIGAELSLSVCKAYKEIPGLPRGDYDKDALFRALLQKESGETPVPAPQAKGNGVLQTERLILRRWTEADAEDLYTWAKDPAVGPIAGWPPHGSVAESRAVIRDVFGGPEAYAICRKDDGRPIGAMELKLKGNTDLTGREDECELGYWLAKPFWGQGLATEAAREMVRHAFEDLGMDQVWCGYYDGNSRSQRVQEKVGFRYRWTSESVDVPLLHEKRRGHVNSLTRAEWLEQRA